MDSPVLDLRQVSKSFSGVRVLNDVTLTLRDQGSILGLVGENGAGKSTLMNILGGVLSRDSGEICLEGKPYNPRDAVEAEKNGIALIHQEVILFSNMSIAENLYLHSAPGGVFGLLSFRTMVRDAAAVLARVGVNASPSTLVDRLSMGQRQLVEIAKALAKNARVIIFDEPTTSLSAAEKKHLFAIIRELSRHGISIIFISHNLGDVLDLCDDVGVLRDGSIVAQSLASALTSARMISLMVGRKLDQLFPFMVKSPGEPALEVRNLCQGRALKDVNLLLHKGEIVGLFGLMGAGRTELARAIFGLDGIDAGSIAVDGRDVARPSPEWGIENGMAFITEDRRSEGLLLPKSVGENLALASLDRLSNAFGMMNARSEENATASLVEQLRIKTYDKSRQVVQTLSGGNQQKVVIGKWLLTEPKVLIADEPTRGVDVGAKHEIYNLLNEMAAKGCAILFISSEMEELIGVCDRIVVMSDGAIAGELARDEFDQDKLLALALSKLTDDKVALARPVKVRDGFYNYGLYVALVLLGLVFTALNSNFASPANVVNLLQQTASTGISAAGLAFVMIAGGIDISLGSVIFLAAVVTAKLAGMGMGVLAAFAVAIAAGCAVGCANGFFVSVLGVPPLIVTLASLYVVRGLGLALTGVADVTFFNPVGEAVAYTRIAGFLPLVVVILAATLICVQFVLSRTMFGRHLFAIGHKQKSAQILGIKVRRNLFLTYAISGALAGLAGLISGAQVGAVTPSFAEGQEFIIITSAILGGVSLFGGKGSALPGVFLGVLIVMCIENGLVMAGANSYAYTVVRGGVIFFAVMIDCLRNKGEIR